MVERWFTCEADFLQFTEHLANWKDARFDAKSFPERGHDAMIPEECMGSFLKMPGDHEVMTMHGDARGP